MNNAQIIWMASYPKSGNTLFENFQNLNFLKKENMQDYKKLSDFSTQKNLIENEFRDEMVKFKYL